MAKPFSELREHLLQAGVAPRHVRRYLTELEEHLADLIAEEQLAGHGQGEAESIALLRLGTVEDLSRAMTKQRQFQSWTVRAPWAIFGLAPLGLLAGAWFVALSMLWSGWQVFLPGADTPFGSGHGKLDGLANLYFQFDRALYFTAPVLIGWAIAVSPAGKECALFGPRLVSSWLRSSAAWHRSMRAARRSPRALGISAWTSRLGRPCRSSRTPRCTP